MSTRAAPNPHSPYADADPDVRHLFPNPTFFPDPTPGALLPAACGGMAVVPTEPLHVTPDEHLPEGLCPACVAQMRGRLPAPSKAHHDRTRALRRSQTPPRCLWHQRQRRGDAQAFCLSDAAYRRPHPTGWGLLHV